MKHPLTEQQLKALESVNWQSFGEYLKATEKDPKKAYEEFIEVIDAIQATVVKSRTIKK
jgi:hypothetical protein